MTRTRLDPATLYPTLHRFHAAGWLTKAIENDEERLARATPGRGPGRRRTFYALTPDGRHAAQTEIANQAKQPKKVPET